MSACEFVSVIVPAYNAERYLSRCIGSILNQSYQNFELLLVDDGSTDHGPELCDGFAKQDPRVRVFHKTNGGAASARNYGLDQMRGQYILFVDADDEIPANHICVLYEELIRHGADISVCSVKYVPGPLICHSPAVLDTKQCLEALLYRDGIGDYPVGKLYCRSLFDNLRFQVGITSEDFEIFYRLFKGAQRVVITDRTVYYYIQRPESVSSGGFNPKFFNRIEICERLIRDVQAEYPDILPAAYSRAVDENIWLYGIVPKSCQTERMRIKRTVRSLSRLVYYDPKAPLKIKRRIAVYFICPLLWRLRMHLKVFLIKTWNR